MPLPTLTEVEKNNKNLTKYKKNRGFVPSTMSKNIYKFH